MPFSPNTLATALIPDFLRLNSAGGIAVGSAVGLGFGVSQVLLSLRLSRASKQDHLSSDSLLNQPASWLALGMIAFPLIPFCAHALRMTYPQWISSSLLIGGLLFWIPLLYQVIRSKTERPVSPIIAYSLTGSFFGLFLSILTSHLDAVPGSDPAATAWTANQLLATRFNYATLHPFQRVYPDAWITWIAQVSEALHLPPHRTALEVSRWVVAFFFAGAAGALDLFQPQRTVNSKWRASERVLFSGFICVALYTPLIRWIKPGQLAFVSALAIALPISLIFIKKSIQKTPWTQLTGREAVVSGLLLGGTVLYHYTFAPWLLALLIGALWSLTLSGSFGENFKRVLRFFSVAGITSLAIVLPKLVVLLPLHGAWKRDPETLLPPVQSFADFFHATVSASVHQLTILFNHAAFRWVFLAALLTQLWMNFRSRQAPDSERLTIRRFGHLLGILALVLTLGGSGLAEQLGIPGVSSHYVRRLWDFFAVFLLAFAWSLPWKKIARPWKIALGTGFAIALGLSAQKSIESLQTSSTEVTPADQATFDWLNSQRGKTDALPSGNWISQNYLTKFHPTNRPPTEMLPYWSGRETLLSFVPTANFYRTNPEDLQLYLSTAAITDWNPTALHRLFCRGIRLIYSRHDYDGPFSSAAVLVAARKLQYAPTRLKIVWDTEALGLNDGSRVVIAAVTESPDTLAPSGPSGPSGLSGCP